jgi:HD-GYP domain-containing protein (c-di-GMP phosphodiesterase class II)
VAPRSSLNAKVERLRAIRDEGQVTRSLMQARCDRGAEIVRKLGFSEQTAEAIRALDEHWDGRGQPRGLRGEQIPPAARILCLAQTVEVFHATRGVGAAYRVAAKRRGQWFEPRLVEALGAFRDEESFWASLDEPNLDSARPPDRVLIADENLLDRIADAFAEVIDAKSPWTHRHCTRVCAIATGIGELLGFDERALHDLGRAALLHDIGKLSVSNRILDKRGPLTDAEYARIKDHPLLTRRILERVPGFSELAPVAGAHHERLDGSGYPRGLAAAELTMPMRVLAVADAYEALTSARPYRSACGSERALELIRAEVPQRLDRDAFAALEALIEERRTDVRLAESLQASERSKNVGGAPKE